MTILVDAFAERQDMHKDWGYAALVEHNGKRILFDTGNNAELFKANAETLGVDLAGVDVVVISHRHGDHTDGLKHLLRVHPDVTIYVPNDEYFGGPTPAQFFAKPVPTLPPQMRYFDGKVPHVVPHGSPWTHARLQRVAGTHEIAPGIRVVRNLSPGGSFTETPELSLVLDTPDGQIVLAGCSHPGVETILSSVDAQTRRVRALIGGFHWVTTPDAEIERLVARLTDTWNVELVAPGHCTGEVGFDRLRRAYGRRYLYAGVGTTITLD